MMNDRCPTGAVLTTACAVLLLALSPARAEDAWPDLASPAKTVGGGERDAAVVVGIEGYAFVSPVPGARSNARQWYEYLTRTRGVPAQNVKLLTDEDGAKEQILDAARTAAGRVAQGGTLWFVFVGHGAPAADGKDGLLVGMDARQTAESLQQRSVRRGELLKVLGTSRASSISVVLDACFSGRGPDGAALASGLQPMVTIAAAGAVDPRMTVLTAAKGDQFAGALPGGDRPAFSYLVLGGLRGWAADKDGKVTAGSLWRYATNALEATLRGRKQEPDILGKQATTLALSAGEKGPDLAKLAMSTSGGGARGELFKLTSLAAVPRAQAPAALTDMGAGADFRDLDIDALKKYNAATVFDKSAAAAAAKAKTWRELAVSAPKFAQKAEMRALDWDRYAAELFATEEARRKRAQARDADWAKLSELLPLEVVSTTDKKRWAAAFVQAYGSDFETNPHAANLAGYLPAGTVKKPAGPDRTGKRSQAIPGGGWITHLIEGSGPLPTSEDTVKAHYRGTLVDGTEFDSSYKRGVPFEASLKGGLISCWLKGIPLVKKGGKALLVCPPETAYGERGAPPLIKGGATLNFEIELIDIVGR